MRTTSIKNAYCCTSKISSKYIVEQNVLFIHHGAILDWHGAGMKAADSVVQRGFHLSQLRGELLSFTRFADSVGSLELGACGFGANCSGNY